MKKDTQLVHLGRSAPGYEQPVNLPVYRASTILSPDVESYLTRFADGRRYEKVTYAATGTQNARALASAVAEIEGGAGAIVTATGLSAVTMTITALVAAGDHILVTDSVYGPTRNYCTDILGRFGVETTFYDPLIGADIASMIRENTRLIFLEAPGSLTFEMQDVPAIVAAAGAAGALTAMDNTWASPINYRPIEHGVDVSIQAGTKYIAGHSDLVIGIITSASEAIHRRVADQVMATGDMAGPDDCYLALRGLRTLAVRLRQQGESAVRVAGWLAERPEVERVLFPPLPGDPGHELWKRDFDGPSSLFGLVLETSDRQAIARLVDGLRLFHIGSSWGGYESLIAMNPTPLKREVATFGAKPWLLRLHVGLEDADDLIADLEAGFGRLAG